MRSSAVAHAHPSAVLHDDVALDEIELYAEVLVAAARTDRPLGPDELDRVLGVRRDRPDPHADRTGHGFPPFNRLFTESA